MWRLWVIRKLLPWLIQNGTPFLEELITVPPKKKVVKRK